jgi:peptide/nickel transport system substrate-binding protein
VKPLNDPVVRKAISMAINRRSDLNSVYGSYVVASNSTGVSPISNWFDPAIAKANDWTNMNVTKANAMLTAAGYKMGSNGVRDTPSGKPMDFTIETGATSTDYVQLSEDIATQVKPIGIHLTVEPKSWDAVGSDIQSGHFQLVYLFGSLGPTPYDFYNDFMSCNNVVPVGKEAAANFGRFCDQKATKLLAQFAAATTAPTEHKLADALEAEFAAQAPIIPQFTEPDLGEFNTTRFTGWPSASNPYATGQTRYPGSVLVLTTVKPVA